MNDYDIELFHATSVDKAEKIKNSGFQSPECGILGYGFYFFSGLLSTRCWGVLKGLNSVVKVRILTASEKACKMEESIHEFREAIKEIRNSIEMEFSEKCEMLSFFIEYFARSNNYTVISYVVKEGDLFSSIFNEDELMVLRNNSRFCVTDASIIRYLGHFPNS